MMRNAAIRTILTFILCLINSGVAARVGFVLDKTFTVPGLASISLLRFNGSSVGGPLSALASDKHKLILYSPTADSTLFTAAADSNEFYVGIEYADVNRDSVPDISDLRMTDPNSVSFGDSTRVTLDVYASADVNLLQKVQLDLYPGIEVCGGLSNGPILKALDLDGDGYNELIASTEKTQGYGNYDNWRVITSGETYLYSLAPESNKASWNVFATSVVELGPGAGPTRFLVTTQSSECGYMAYLPPGQWTYVTEQLQLFTPSGVGAILATDTAAPAECTYTRIDVACVGSISPLDPRPQILISPGATSSRCDTFPRPPDIVSRSLELLALTSLDSAAVLWSHDITGLNYTDFMFHPQLPGTFFAFSGDTLLMFRGSDGSIRDRLTQVPSGARHWDYPYSDSIPRLIVVNGSTVSIYRLEIATDVADQSNNRSLPAEFTLSNPFPNPFNPSSSFTVGTGPGGTLDVAIFNTLGQRVLTLYDGKVLPNSTMTFHWEMPQRASGIYFVRAQLGSAALVRKMLFLK